MREDFLHFLWRRRRFDGRELRTTDGQPLEILEPGEPHHDAGPDFQNARIRIDGTLWAGAVEIHLRASDWLAHRHDADRAYDNVVLHVVLDADQAIRRHNGEVLPCLSLRRRIPPKLLENYGRLEHERSWIPCAHFLPEVPAIVRAGWLDRLLVERLEQKTARVADDLAATDNHWEEAFYRALARSFGLKVNAEAFEALARSLPLLLVARHSSRLFQLEALLFGQAGLLSKAFQEDHPKALAREYGFLRQKFRLTPLEGSRWKFLRMRPVNFPTLRLAQFAALLQAAPHLFSQTLDAGRLQDLEHLFSAEPNAYWTNHYLFDKISPPRAKHPGRDFIHLLVINTVAPFLFHYGKTKHQPEFQDKAIRLLEQIPAEHNSILEGWEALGISAGNAFQSQALLHLKTQYCDAKRCLECAIGNAIL